MKMIIPGYQAVCRFQSTCFQWMENHREPKLGFQITESLVKKYMLHSQPCTVSRSKAYSKYGSGGGGREGYYYGEDDDDDD